MTHNTVDPELRALAYAMDTMSYKERIKALRELQQLSPTSPEKARSYYDAVEYGKLVAPTVADDEVEQLYYRCDVSNNRTEDPISLEEFKAAIVALRQADRDEMLSRHMTDLARAVGILEGLGHPDTLLERHYNELMAKLSPPEKEQK